MYVPKFKKEMGKAVDLDDPDTSEAGEGCSEIVGLIKKKPDFMSGFFVEITGVEPVTFCMPCKRSSQLS